MSSAVTLIWAEPSFSRHVFSDDGSSLVMKREIAKALEDDGSNDYP